MTSIDSPGDAVDTGETPDVADADLVLRTRSGDKSAFGELWYRHYRSGITVARSVSPGLDADDLVQEAYARIYQSILRGGGPTGSFRAYLFTSIRNTAAAWGRSGRESTVDLLDTVEDPATSDEATDAALDRSLTHRAFRSLPTRWQEVLWYTEIEQMKPGEVAPLLGMKPTAVAQLAFRAREGLREAWIQAHLQSVEDGSDCQWTIERLGAHARENLSRRDRRKVDEHLTDCARCTIVAAEAKSVSNRLALVLLPLALGATGAAAYLATLQGGGVPAVALAAGAAPVVPAGLGQGAGIAGGAWSGAGGSTAAAGATAAGSTAAGSTAAGGAVALSAPAAAAGVGAVAATAGAGGLLSGIGAIVGVTAAAAVLVSTAVTASLVGPSAFALPEPSAATTASAAAAASADSAEAASDTADSRSDDDEPGSPSFPDGTPSVAGASVAFSGTQPTFTLAVSGEPGATVEVLLNGAVADVASLTGGGDASVALSPTYGQVNSDARVGLRYRVGAWAGDVLTLHLSDLADLAPILAAMKPEADRGDTATDGQGTTAGDGSGRNGNGPSTNSGNGPSTNSGNGPSMNSGNGPSTNSGKGPATNSGKGAPGDPGSANSGTGGDQSGSTATGRGQASGSGNGPATNSGSGPTANSGKAVTPGTAPTAGGASAPSATVPVPGDITGGGVAGTVPDPAPGDSGAANTPQSAPAAGGPGVVVAAPAPPETSPRPA